MSNLLLVKRLQQSLRENHPDADLLAAFVARRDNDAFAALVSRYGPLVLSVCRRQLHKSTEVDDATQTTFLTLIREARRVQPESLASWLVCVARRTCSKIRLAESRRLRREFTPRPVARTTAPDAEMSVSELLALLDEELIHLPSRYRSALLACYWQGLTQAEAARQEGTSMATIKGLLERGRAKLLDRLRRRGLTADVALRGLLAAPLALVSLPDKLYSQTIELASGPTQMGMAGLPSLSLTLCAGGGVLAIALGVGLLLSGSLPTELPKGQTSKAEAPPAALPVAKPSDDDPLPDKALLRLGTVRFKHPNTAHELALSPDGKFLATSGSGQMIIGWETATGKKLWEANSQSHMGGSYAGERLLAFTPDGKRLLAPMANPNSFMFVDVANGGQEWLHLKGETDRNRPTAVDVSPDGQSLAIGTSNGVFLTDLKGTVLHKIAHPGPQQQPFKNPDRLLFQGDYSFARFSPDGKSLAVVTSDLPKALRFYDPDTGKERKRIELTAYLVRLAFSPDSERVAVTERDNSVRVYKVDDGKRLHSWTVKLNNPNENYTSAVAYSPDGKLVAAGATDNAIYLWDAATGRDAGQLKGSGWYPWSLAFSPDSKMLYSTGWDGVVRRWDVAACKQLPLPNGAVRGSDAVAASADGKWLAYEDEEGIIHVVDAKSGQEKQRLKTENSGSARMVFSPDSRRLATGGSHADQVDVILWDLAAGKVLRRWDWDKGRDPHSTVEDIVFSPDGKQLAVAVFRRHEARVLDISGDGQRVLGHESVYGLDFAPDSATLATAGWDRQIRLWNPKTGQLLRQQEVPWQDERKHDTRMYGVRFSPDGRTLATAHMNSRVYLWSVKSLKVKNSFEIEGGFIFNALAYSPDGLRLATGDGGGHVRVWDSHSGTKLWEGNMGGYVYTVEFGHHGRALLASANGVGYLWDTRPRELPGKELAQLWSDLTGADSVAADSAFWSLADRPEEAVKLLSKNVQPKSEVDVERVEKLIPQLGDPEFKVRETAESELAKLGKGTVPQLKKALIGNDSAEMRERLTRLLDRLMDNEVTQRRYQRLVGLLALVNTPEARKLLHDWAELSSDSLAEYAATAAKKN
jgi:RNA polymerase sigma factor (sigma-70 family)